MSENGKKNVDKTYTDPETGKFIKGNPGGGRPPGKRNFATDLEEAVRKIAHAKKIDMEDVYIQLGVKGITQALQGDFRFWDKIYERLYGKVPQGLEHSGPNGEPMQVESIQIKPYEPEEENS